MDDKGSKTRQKKKKMTAKQIPFPEDEEEEGDMQRKSLALLVWYLPVIDSLCALFGNPAKFPKEFGDEARNIKFALSTDGMNPLDDLSSSHST